MISNRSLRCRLTPQMVLCIFIAENPVNYSLKVHEAASVDSHNLSLPLLQSVHGVVNTAYTNHFPEEPGEPISSCLASFSQPLGAQQCPSEHTGEERVCVETSLHMELQIASCVILGMTEIGRALYFAILITYLCHSAPPSLCLPLLIFRFLPFLKIHISPRHGFTKLSLSAFDERLFAGFLPSYWRLTFFLV